MASLSVLSALMVMHMGAQIPLAQETETGKKGTFGLETEVGKKGTFGQETESELAAPSSRTASSSDMVPVQKVTEDWMVPVTAQELRDGEYEIDVNSSSSMFQIASCTLKVADGAMRAEMTMSGTGYLYLYPGTPEEAAAAKKEALIPFQEMEDGTHVFTIPVAKLDESMECAAYSKRKEKWYGRQLCFVAESLSPDAFLKERGNSAANLDLEDGHYTAEVALSGGSGRASVASPAAIRAHQGELTATIEWSSSNYDYMIVDGEKYLPVNKEGNSVFEIPVTAFDRPIHVKADTTAMSKPYEIEYELTFDSETITKQ